MKWKWICQQIFILNIFQKLHSEKHLEYKEAQKLLPKGPKRKLEDSDEKGSTSHGGKQPKLKFPVLTKTTNQQTNFDSALIDYVVNSIRPFSTVSDENFKNMIKAANPSLKVLSRPTLMRRIKDEEGRWKEIVKTQLKEAEFVSTTADVWSSHHHSYMGVSAHYITKNLKRRQENCRAVFLESSPCAHFRKVHSNMERHPSTESFREHQGHYRKTNHVPGCHQMEQPSGLFFRIDRDLQQ